MKRPTVGSLFSGIGGLELAVEEVLGAEVRWQCDADPVSRAVLADHWPGVRIFEDVRGINGGSAERVDVICGGFPCQDLSVAGRQEGIGASRSGLWWEFRRVVRMLRPGLVFVENVGHTWRRWVPTVRRSLWRVGYASVSIRVSAAEVGAPHERARCFVLAHPLGEPVRIVEQRIAPGRQACRVRDQGQALARHHGDARSLADADGEGQLQPRGRLGKVGGRLVDGSLAHDPWAVEPDVGRVAHGVPARVDRLRLLGNACVPQQAAAALRELLATARTAG